MNTPTEVKQQAGQRKLEMFEVHGSTYLRVAGRLPWKLQEALKLWARSATGR